METLYQIDMSLLDYVDMGTLGRTLIKLETKEIYQVDKKQLFANSICLIIVTSAKNRDDLEQQVAMGKNITFVIGKVAMIVMSDNMLDTFNMTKVPFPVMLMKSDGHIPRYGMQYFFFMVFQRRQKFCLLPMPSLLSSSRQ